MNYLAALGVRGNELLLDLLQLARELGDRRMTAGALVNLGTSAYLQRDYQRAQELAEEGVQLAREIGERRLLAVGLNRLGDFQRIQGYHTQAIIYFEEALALFHKVGDIEQKSWVLHNMGYVALHQGSNSQATSFFSESLLSFRALGTEWGIVSCLTGLAGVAQAMGQPERAARLFGMVEEFIGYKGIVLEPVDQAEYERKLAATRAQLNEPTFAAAWTEGQTMTLEQAVAYAIEDT
jgi:tetratricopeptide (TPR) repeat protein